MRGCQAWTWVASRRGGRIFKRQDCLDMRNERVSAMRTECIGSDFDDWLRAEGLLEQVRQVAFSRLAGLLAGLVWGRR